MKYIVKKHSIHKNVILVEDFFTKLLDTSNKINAKHSANSNCIIVNQQIANILTNKFSN